MAQTEEPGGAGVAPKDATPIFRTADHQEDDLLSRILCNAFLPVWNHNWFHGVSQPLEPVPQSAASSKPSLTSLQRSRVRFYRALIELARRVGGIVSIAEVPGTESSNGAKTRDIGAILLWLPPSKRLGAFDILTLYRSGFLSLMLPWHYGLTGFHRVQSVFEENVVKMWSRTLPDLPPHGFKEHECAFVQMIAHNPEYAGKGYASALLKYQIEQHFAAFPDRPILLDTTTDQAIRAYERLGFRLLAETPVDTGTDAKGIWLKKDASEQVRKEAKEMCVQRVMARLPGPISS